jgi:hypothetical protein
MSKEKASCFSNLIVNQMKELYMQQAHKTGTVSDWRDSGSPTSGPFWEKMNQASRTYDTDMEAYRQALDRCNRITEHE